MNTGNSTFHSLKLHKPNGEEIYVEIERQCLRAKQEIEGEIARWYQWFADNNEVSIAEDRKMLLHGITFSAWKP